MIETAVSDESQVREDDDIALAQSISNVSARLNIGAMSILRLSRSIKAQAAKDGKDNCKSHEPAEPYRQRQRGRLRAKPEMGLHQYA